jgi:hypothetical protein
VQNNLQEMIARWRLERSDRTKRSVAKIADTSSRLVIAKVVTVVRIHQLRRNRWFPDHSFQSVVDDGRYFLHE